MLLLLDAIVTHQVNLCMNWGIHNDVYTSCVPLKNFLTNENKTCTVEY